MNENGAGFFKLSYYRVLFPVAILGTLLGWGIEQFVEADAETFDSVLLLGTAAWFALMGLLFWKKPGKRRTLELVLCVGVAAFILVRLAYAVYFLDPDDSFGDELTEFAFWIPAFFGLKFLWFGIDAGRRTATAYLVLLALLPIPAEALGRLPVGSVYGLSMLLLASGVSIFIYHVLGRTLIQFGAEKRAMEHLAVIDHLTGVANRRGLHNKLTEELARAQRYGGRFSVLLLDLDHFKRINDQHGHQIGDQVLIEFVKVLEEECREADMMGRWGGEEFLAILPQTGAQKSAEVASRIRKAVAKHEFHDAFDVTVSIGVAECHAGEPIERLIARADEALYKAKERGRNRVKIAT